MKKYSFKKFYLFFSSFFLFILHIPFVFAKNKPAESFRTHTKKQESAAATGPLLLDNEIGKNNNLSNLYDSMRLNIMGLSQQAFQYAMQGFDYLVKVGKISNDKIISIVDFSQPSSKKRLFVIDLQNYKVLYNTYVAHGMNSGREFAQQFSNAPQSYKSSLGFYETGTTYIGSNGYSLKLEGLEKGINDNASRRDIVIHGADYVNESYIHSQGYIGRSQGCPALPPAKSKPIIDKIKNGTCLFIYSPDRNYYIHSKILQQTNEMVTTSKN